MITMVVCLVWLFLSSPQLQKIRPRDRALLLIENYESKAREYEHEKERLRLGLGITEEKLKEMEESLGGGLGGGLVLVEETAILGCMSVEKLRSRLSDLPLLIKALWGGENR